MRYIWIMEGQLARHDFYVQESADTAGRNVETQMTSARYFADRTNVDKTRF